MPGPDHPACAITKVSGVTSMEQWFAAKEPIKFGGVGRAGPPLIFLEYCTRLSGCPSVSIDDYKGTADIRLATESGELAGGCLGWESLKTTWRKGDESGEEVEAIVQGLYKIEPAFIARMKQVLVSQLQQVSPVSIVPSVPVVESGPRSRRTSHRQDCRRCQ